MLRLASIQQELQIPVIFKASFDKANRQDLSRYAHIALVLLQQALADSKALAQTLTWLGASRLD